MSVLSGISWLQEGPFALYRWGDLFEDIPLFMEAFIYTIGISICA